jgi:hypothetical protein
VNFNTAAKYTVTVTLSLSSLFGLQILLFIYLSFTSFVGPIPMNRRPGLQRTVECTLLQNAAHLIPIDVQMIALSHATHILLRGLPLTATSGDVRRAVMNANMKGVAEGEC